MSLLITSGHTATPGIRRRTLSSRVELGATSLVFVVVALAFVVSLIYLAHANKVATRGYILKQMETEKNTLITQNEIWQQRVSENKSLEAIKNSPAVERMVSVKEATYIRVSTE